MAIQKLPTEIISKGFTYIQIERHGDLAIFSQRKKSWPESLMRYEVIVIHVKPEVTWPDGSVVPAHEYYPGSTTWGKSGWTCFTLQEAQALLKELQAKRAATAEV
jgi:hypothetical protein